MKYLATVMVVLGLLSLPGDGIRAQVPWDAPFMVPPQPTGGLSVLLTDPGWGVGVLAMWQGSGTPYHLGYRVGLAEDPFDELAVLGGVDVSAELLAHSREFPLDVAWVSGVGIGISDAALVTIPLGVSMGRVLTSGQVRIQPYVTPRVVLDAWFGDDRCPGPGKCGDDDDLDLGLVVDVGFDLAVSRNWLIRFGAAVGDREALAVGVILPL